MKCYKGFNSKLQCQPGERKEPFQYEVGETYTEEKADLCHTGFHACENPMDVFGYYAPSDSRFCVVALDDVDSKKDNDSKVCGKKIHIEAEIGLKGIIEAGVKFIMDKVDFKNAKATNTGNYSVATNTGYQSAATNTGNCSAATNTGNYSAATNTGRYSVATNTGYYSVATNTGNYSVATNTGRYSVATNTGYYSVATNTGNYSVATNTGRYSVATNTGNCSAATNTGYQSAATNTGNYSVATVEGKESVAASLGIKGKAKGNIGSWIVLAEWEEDENYNLHRTDVKCVQVDGEKIKADTFYTLKNGKFVEWAED